LILRAVDGQRFVLTSIEDWQGFDVGTEHDSAREVKLTGRNRELMKFLAERRSHGKTIPLAIVKEQLGFESRVGGPRLGYVPQGGEPPFGFRRLVLPS
jgi:hypothetical protein